MAEDKEKDAERHRQEYARLVAQNRARGLGADEDAAELAAMQKAKEDEQKTAAESQERLRRETKAREVKGLVVFALLVVLLMVGIKALPGGGPSGGTSYEDSRALRR